MKLNSKCRETWTLPLGGLKKLLLGHVMRLEPQQPVMLPYMPHPALAVVRQQALRAMRMEVKTCQLMQWSANNLHCLRAQR